MDLELRCMLAITHRLPPVRGAGRLSVWLRRLYNRQPRAPVPTVVRLAGRGFELELDPAEDVDANMLFHPQLFDRAELAFLAAHLPRGGTFIDIGANVGAYALVAARNSSSSRSTLLLIFCPCGRTFPGCYCCWPPRGSCRRRGGIACCSSAFSSSPSALSWSSRVRVTAASWRVHGIGVRCIMCGCWFWHRWRWPDWCQGTSTS